jgi:hypothetical protein
MQLSVSTIKDEKLDLAKYAHKLWALDSLHFVVNNNAKSR